VETYDPNRVVVGLDARGRTPAVRGWTEAIDRDLFDIGCRNAELGVRHILYTDSSRDGMLGGPNLPLSVELAHQTGAKVLVSGGVGTLDDIRAVREAAELESGIEGVIVGKAIYEGRIRVAEAVEQLRAGHRGQGKGNSV